MMGPIGPDYAVQRSYTASAGRFYTPDPAGMKGQTQENPTSWNMYVYANDDPVNFNDPKGCRGGPNSNAPDAGVRAAAR